MHSNKVIIIFYCEHLLRNDCEPTVLLERERNLPVIQNLKYMVLQDNIQFFLSQSLNLALFKLKGQAVRNKPTYLVILHNIKFLYFTQKFLQKFLML
jgi:hypothetical protein